MSDKKTIRINPDLFQYSTTNKTRKKERSNDRSKPIRIKSDRHNRTTKNTKNQLLKYIREQQEKNYKRFSEQSSTMEELSTNMLPSETTAKSALSTPYTNPMTHFESDFEDSLKYLSSVAEKAQKTATPTLKHNTTMRNLPSNTESLLMRNVIPYDSVGIEMPDVFSTIEPANTSPMHIRPRPSTIFTPPKYGCLKNGTLPTYRMWKNQTMKMPLHNSVGGAANTPSGGMRKNSGREPFTSSQKAPRETLSLIHISEPTRPY